MIFVNFGWNLIKTRVYSADLYTNTGGDGTTFALYTPVQGENSALLSNGDRVLHWDTGISCPWSKHWILGRTVLPDSGIRQKSGI